MWKHRKSTHALNHSAGGGSPPPNCFSQPSLSFLTCESVASINSLSTTRSASRSALGNRSGKVESGGGSSGAYCFQNPCGESSMVSCFTFRCCGMFAIHSFLTSSSPKMAPSSSAVRIILLTHSILLLSPSETFGLPLLWYGSFQ